MNNGIEKFTLSVMNRDEVDKFLFDHKNNGCSAIQAPPPMGAMYREIDEYIKNPINYAWTDDVTGERVDIEYSRMPIGTAKVNNARNKEMLFEYCPSCGGDLDTGWECNNCDRDWRPWAYPWWNRLLDKLRRLSGITG